jgi:hypothetical protein
MLTGQEFLEVQEKMEITGSEVRAVGWMIKHLPAEILQETCCPSSRLWPSVIVQEDNTGTTLWTPLVYKSMPSKTRIESNKGNYIFIIKTLSIW